MKNEPDFAIANRGQLVVVHFRDILAVELVAAGARGIEAAEHVHERRFAAAARAHDGEVFVAMNLQRDTAQRVDDFLAHHVFLGDVLDVDDDRTGRRVT